MEVRTTTKIPRCLWKFMQKHNYGKWDEWICITLHRTDYHQHHLTWKGSQVELFESLHFIVQFAGVTYFIICKSCSCLAVVHLLPLLLLLHSVSVFTRVVAQVWSVNKCIQISRPFHNNSHINWTHSEVHICTRVVSILEEKRSAAVNIIWPNNVTITISLHVT